MFVDLIGRFIDWFKRPKFVYGLLIRLVIAGVMLVFFYISIPVFVIYFLIKNGHKRLEGCPCSVCGELNSCSDNYCIYCGGSIIKQEQKRSFTSNTITEPCYCETCKKEIDCNDKFCIHCGVLQCEYPSLYREVKNGIDGIYIFMLAKVAKADGTVNAQEAKYISSVFDMILENVDDKKQRRTVYKKNI